ncbi:hypothetical protein C7C46_05295 [Streptomyces tateyamensis]|uniref:Uncharacterized protein n=1 Tax=Streptomyces tateyamensis TaxID=565073 RepID=A0A2V4NLL8_9ACTN|nr:hypothetical protein [Streptomyces tateyamensis]PYC86907.1 hypothetical protein C7C46_05295 [Streptomyces tateyamensis]
MQKMLGKAAAVAVGALMIAGVAAPAYAHVSTGGEGGGVVSADEPFVAGWGEGFACTDHVHTDWMKAFWATDEATGGEGSHHVDIDGWHHHHHG